jgi:hypothetical protein
MKVGDMVGLRRWATEKLSNDAKAYEGDAIELGDRTAAEMSAENTEPWTARGRRSTVVSKALCAEEGQEYEGADGWRRPPTQ